MSKAWDITTTKARARLPERKEPYWQRLGDGCYVGFRRGPDTFCARYRGPDGATQFEHFGACDADHATAVAAAQAWFGTMGAAVTAGAGATKAQRQRTVRDALDAYLGHLRRMQRGPAAVDADQKFDACGIREDSEPFGGMQLQAVTREHVEAWRARMRDRKLAAQSVNRYFRSVRAALNCAVKVCGFIGNPQAWKLDALPEHRKRDDDAPTVYISQPHLQRLLKCCEPELQAFLRAIYLSGGRPGELAAAVVRDYDAEHGTLVLASMKGRPAVMRPRRVQIAPKDMPYFASLTRGKTPAAPLCPDDRGGHWETHKWSRHIRAALTYANAANLKDPIDERTSAYSLRHTRISELLQLYKIDPLTVAQQTGTSLKMMEDYYFKFLPSAMVDAFEQVSGRTTPRRRSKAGQR